MADQEVAGPSLPTSAPEAMARGAPRYYTGEPCSAGHFATRQTSNRKCSQCDGLAKRAKPAASVTTNASGVIPSSISEARATGSRHYFTGKPCKRGHVAKRTATTGNCVTCVADAVALFGKQNPERLRAYRSKIGPENSETVRARNQRRYKADPEHFRARSRVYDAKHPDVGRARNQTRRAKKRAAAGTFTAAEFAAVVKQQRHRCAYCRQPFKGRAIHRDHIVPLSRGGSNRISNIQALCPKCNGRKYNHDPVYFARLVGLLI